MNKQNFVTQIIIAIVAVFVRKPSVQAHITKATSLFDGVLKNIDKSLDTLHAEVTGHNTTIVNLKERVASERLLAESKHKAQYKLRTLRSKITDIVG